MMHGRTPPAVKCLSLSLLELDSAATNVADS